MNVSICANDEVIEPPWYRQFWPWVIIGIPAITVVACAVLLTLAIVSDDGLVSDDYYREGLAINKELEAAEKSNPVDD